MTAPSAAEGHLGSAAAPITVVPPSLCKFVGVASESLQLSR